ncbi:MAG: hypothetical protein KY447_05125 [Actinobacteria bacterium]|nr:hypothetical protein [Actinomycetota bacterium]
MASEQRYLTQPEAAALCGCDYSTIKRHRERGHFPNLRRRDDVNATYEIPLSDLIAARLWKPTEAEDEDVEAAIGRTRSERRLEEMRLELERTRAEAKALAAAFEQSREEIAYLRNALHLALGRAS